MKTLSYTFAILTTIMLACTGSNPAGEITTDNLIGADDTYEADVLLEVTNGTDEDGRTTDATVADPIGYDVDNATDNLSIDSTTETDAIYDAASDAIDDSTVSDEDTTANTDAFECPAEQPASPQQIPCLTWTCTVVAAPDCWSCLYEPADDGISCDPPGTLPGGCVEGTCVALDRPEEEGSANVGTDRADLELSGGLFGTTIPMDIYLPDGTGPFPTVVFHHGFQLDPDLYASYGNHLASWGYVVVMPKMPAGLVGIGAPNHKTLKEYLSSVLDWVESDAAAGVNGALKGKADFSRLALAGHSMGGKISLLVSTEDARPKAVFAIDPVDAVGSPLPTNEEDYPSVTPELMEKIQVPLVLLGETVNGTCEGFMCQACAPEEDNFHQYFIHATSPAIEIEVVGANHMSFLDDPDCGLTCSVCPDGTDDPATTRMLTQRYMTAFFEMHLRQNTLYDHWLTGDGMTADVAAGLVKTANNL